MRVVADGSVILSLLGVSALALDAKAPEAPPPPPNVPKAFVERCEALNNLNIEKAADTPGKIVLAQVVSGRPATKADQRMFEKRGHSQGHPAKALTEYPVHCKVEGYVTPAVKFNLVLPLDDKWNKRFMLAACDAWCGKVGEDIIGPGLQNGYATITNDGGHYGRAPFDGIWAHKNIPAREDFAYRANHVSAQAGKFILKAFYGEPQKFSYIAGFSKGGNAGLMAAQRYPEDFDGVFSKAPVVNYNSKNAAHFTWVALAVHPDGKTPLLYSDKVPLLHNAATASCDAADGLKDGIIDDPRVCKFDPGVLLCKAGQSEAKNECLNAAQVEAVRKIYAKPTAANGQVYFNYPTDVGSEHDWARSILPVRGSTEPGAPFALNGAITGLRYMVMRENPGPDYDWTKFDYVKERARIADMETIMDPDAVDLTAFKKRGGKLIILHGWADAMVSANMTIDWFGKMQAAMGGAKATGEFAQLYLMPGGDHGSGGTGPYVFDSQSALVKWVEEGVAPTELLITDEPGKTPFRSRAFYPWPAISKYKGTGDPNLPSSYRRVDPK